MGASWTMREARSPDFHAVGRTRPAGRQWNDLAVAGVITASEPSWIAPFTGLSPRTFGKLVTQLRNTGAEVGGRGRPQATT